MHVSSITADVPIVGIVPVGTFCRVRHAGHVLDGLTVRVGNATDQNNRTVWVQTSADADFVPVSRYMRVIPETSPLY